MKEEQEIYRINQLPVLQNQVFTNQKDAFECTKGDLILVQDMRTGLIFNKAFDPSLMAYTSDYQNEQALSACFQTHLKKIAGLIGSHFRGLFLIEVGCGKGRFLEMLHEDGFDICGLDPAYEGSNPLILKKKFTGEKGLQAGGIILRHVLEHIPDPVDFLMQICEANGGGGKIYIEVPCLDWIRCHNAWFDLFYEHVNYFRIKDFYNLFGRIYDSGHVFGGQYFYAIADLGTIRRPTPSTTDVFTFPRDFSEGISGWAHRLKQKSMPLVLWGGSSKGVIFSLLMQRAGAILDFVIDINPAKQGKFLPVSGLQVYSPEQGMNRLASGADIIVMNGNYLPEIKQETKNRFNLWVVDNEHF
jgi:SAM-dependent methyltransferase